MAVPAAPSSPIRGPSLWALRSALDLEKISTKSRKRYSSLCNFLLSVVLGTFLSLVIQIIVMSRTPCKLMQASIHTTDYLNVKNNYLLHKSPNIQEHPHLRNIVAKPNAKMKHDTKNMSRNIPDSDEKQSHGINDQKAEKSSKSSEQIKFTNEENLVLIGVMTARKFLDTRVLAGHRTWVKDIPGRVIYFCSDVRTSLTNATDNLSQAINFSFKNGRTHYSQDDIRAFMPLEVSANKETNEQTYDMTNDHDIPLVISLPGVNDAYPPQKKSFMMLKFMYENFGQQFNWFVRADDDVYIKGSKLGKLLRSLDSNEPYYIGQTGQGKKEELGTLHLNYDENFCMGGPSMIMSQETLKRMAPHIKYCLNHLYTSHEDVEIGRCVKTFASIPCTWSYETQWLFYHYSSSNSIWIRKSSTKSKRTFENAITLHPFKSHTSFYDASTHYKTQKIEYLRNRLWHLKQYQKANDINLLDRKSNQAKKITPKKSLVPIYAHIVQNQILMATDRSNPRRKIDTELQEQLEELQTQILEHLNQLSRQDGIVFNKIDLFWAYETAQDASNYKYLLNLGLTYRKFGGNPNWLEAMFDVKIPFQDLIFNEIAPVTNLDSSTQSNLSNTNYMAHLLNSKLNKNMLNNLASYIWTSKNGATTINQDSNDARLESREDSVVIHFIVPLYRRLSNFMRFLGNYESTCLKREENAELLVVMFHSDAKESMATDAPKELNITDGINEDDYVTHVFRLVNEMRLKYPHQKSKLKILSVKGEFSRGLALEIGASQYKDDDLLFFVDVDIVFSEGFMRRARTFTQFNQSIYYPAVLSQFNPQFTSSQPRGYIDSKTNATANYFHITDHVGYWRLYGFGLVTIYKHDFRRAGGFDMSILGWGKEDVDLFDKCLFRGYTVFRNPDPSLIHVFHDNDCPSSLENDQFLMCVKSKANNLGSTTNLGHFLYD